MKRLFKSLVVIMVLALAFTLGTPAQVKAAGPATSIKITGTNTNHTYEAYQLFKGEYTSAAGGNHVLSTITWGDAVDPDFVLTSGKKVSEEICAFTPSITTQFKVEKTTLRGDTAGTGEYLKDGKIYVGDEANQLATDPVALRAPKTAEELAEAIRTLTLEADVQAFVAHVFNVIKTAKAQDSSKVYCLTQQATGTSVVFDLTDAVALNDPDYSTSHVKGKGEGYYLIKDKDDSLSSATGEAYTRYIVRVAGNTEIAAKMSVPQVIKKVLENSNITVDNKDSKLDYVLGANYNDTADYSVGDEITFQVIASVPQTINGYPSYKYEFKDLMSLGLTYVQNSATVTIKKGTDSYALVRGTAFDASLAYHMEPNPNASEAGQPAEIKTGIDLTLTINDIKGQLAYNNTANSSNVQYLGAGTVDSSCFIVIEYKAILNENAVVGGNGNANQVYLKYSNNPNDATSMGTTEKDTVWVYTYQVEVTKQNAQAESDGTHNVLAGAEFRLFRNIGGNKTWAVKDTNGNIGSWSANEAEGSLFVSDANGKINIVGLDKGSYGLKEITAPTGFNRLTDPVVFEISESSLSHKQNTTSAATASPSIYVQGSADIAVSAAPTAGLQGAVAMKINNRMGTQLPTTGGAGTTMFYAAGIALVAYATFTLIVRKKVSK